MLSINPMLWFDTDGVLAVCDNKAFREPYENGPPLYLHPESHYFRDLSIDPRMVPVVEQLLSEGISTHILTNIIKTPSNMEREHRFDKQDWYSRNIPLHFEDDRISIIHKPKYEFVLQQRNTHCLQPTDILISDYNQDLFPWVAAGGTGIKYLNGHNSPASYPYHHITPNMSVDDIKMFLLQIMKETQSL